MSDFFNRIREVLRECQDSGDLIEVYHDPEFPERFHVGLVESVSHDIFCIRSIGKHGEFDGRQIGRIEEVIRVATRSEYLSVLRLLNEGQQVWNTAPADPSEYFPLDMQNTLRFAKDKRAVVSLIDNDRRSITGFVINYGREFVEICELRRDGLEDGVTVINMDDVIRIDVGGQTEQTRAFLHRVRMGL